MSAISPAMSMAPPDSKGLHLPTLSIEGFRGIDSLSISRLGRVTLFSGENGVGKTTLLDAVRVYASRGRSTVLSQLLRNHGELKGYTDKDGEQMLGADWAALCYGRRASSETSISIGPDTGEDRLRIEISSDLPTQVDSFGEFPDEGFLAFKILYKHWIHYVPFVPFESNTWPSFSLRPGSRQPESALPPAIRCESLGPGLSTNPVIARFWDKVALTDDEYRATDALNLIFHDQVERVAMIGDDDDSERYPRPPRRAVVRLEGQDRPVPLKSLGDGAVRLFGVALALANCRDGFLLIDEVENGIHYSVQQDFWKMVLQSAQENNVQVLATTYSWDCMAGFATAAAANEEVDGAHIRLERRGGQMRAVAYSEEDLLVAAEQGIEVR